MLLNYQKGLVTNAQVEVCQLHTGTSSHIWQVPFPTIERLISSCEVKYLLRECHHYNITLHGDYSKQSIQRTNDFFLMDHLVTSHLSSKVIRKINQCRLYLQVLTLADITTGDGCHINHHMYHGDLTTHRNSTLK